MKFPKLKLHWNGSRVQARWWLGLVGFYSRGRQVVNNRGVVADEQGVVISIRGLLAWLGVLAVVAYFAGAGALWFWLDRRPYNYVSYGDLVAPWRWGHIEEKRGRAMIDEGMEDLKARRWGSGMQKLRIGLARAPEDLRARLALAEIYLAMRAVKQAEAVYDEGLARRYPGKSYVETVLRVALRAEDYDRVLRTCDRALALIGDRADLADDRRWLVRQKISGLLAAERADEALALAETEAGAGSPAIDELHVLSLLKAGRAADAVAFLGEWSERAQGSVKTQVLRLDVRARREAGDLDGMGRALAAMRDLAPTDPRTYVYAVVQTSLAGRRADATAWLDQFFMRFGSQTRPVQMLCGPLAEIGERAFLERAVAHAEQQGFDMKPYRRHQVEVLLETGDWRAASRMLAGIAADLEPEKKQAEALWHELTTAQVNALLDAGDGTQSTFVSLVRGRQFTLSFYKDAIRRLRRAGRPDTARQIVTFAQGVYPKNEDIESARRELDAELAAAKAAAEPVVIRSRPATEAPQSSAPAREEIGEQAFFTRLDGQMAKGETAEALRGIREIRAANPVWLGGRDLELQRAEVRLSGRVGDVLALRLAARRYLTGDRIRSAQMIEVARDLHGGGRKDEAVVLLREILARTPDYAPAKSLLGQWAPEPPKEKPAGSAP